MSKEDFEMDKIKEILSKNREIISYLIFGLLTTLVNILGYTFLTKVCKINNILSS